MITSTIQDTSNERDLMAEAFAALDPRNTPQYTKANCEMYWDIWIKYFQDPVKASAEALFYANKIEKQDHIPEWRKNKFYTIKEKWMVKHLSYVTEAEIARVEIDENTGVEKPLYLLRFDIDGKLYKFHSYVAPEGKIVNKDQMQNLFTIKDKDQCVYGAPIKKEQKERLYIHEDAVVMALEHYVREF